MSNEALVSAEAVSKKFCSRLKRSLWYGMQDLAGEMLGRRNEHAKLRQDEFWALRDVSFELRRGESLGVIGPNGAGKTTLLRMLNGLIKPDEGRITMRGRVGALIALGAGFNPILSGRENIYVNAAVLGIPKKEIDQKLDEIIDFADIGDFIDAPVQSYSSGMNVRLGFSVAIHMNPDVLLMDELLSVGDMAFGRKSRQRMYKLLNSGVTLVFVSHAIRHVEMLCQKTVFLNRGVVQAYGPTPEVTEKYYAFANVQSLSFEKGGASPTRVGGAHVDPTLFEVTRIELLNEAGEVRDQFRMIEPLVIRVHFAAHRRVERLRAVFKVQTIDGIYVSSFSSRGQDPDWLGPGYMDCVIPELPLREGAYVISLVLGDFNGYLFKSERAADLSVIPDRKAYAQAGATAGLVHIPTSWHFDHPQTLCGQEREIIS